jgi:hypothetical protein
MTLAELADILRRDLGDDVTARVVAVLCREASGERVHIPRRLGRPEIREDDTPNTIQQRHRVSRATAYNWVNRWRA